jgi:hypothetical protein
MHIRAILSACVLAAASLAAALSATAARSDAPPAPVPLPITGYYQMVVDSAHGHLFISQDSKFGSVEVYDFSGNPVAEIPAGAYVRGITLSPDGSTLYAAAMGEVSAISTATLQETVFYPLEPNETAVNVAVQSGKLWVSYTTLNSNTANIGDFDLSAVSKTFEAQPAMGSWPYNAPKLAADPGEHGVLVASDSLNGTPVATFDTGTDPVTPLAAQTYINSCSWGSQLAVLANGTRFAVACQALFPSLYDTANLTARVGSFQIDYGDSAIALAASHDGYVAAGSQQGGVFVFGSAGGAAISFHPLDSSLYLATSGLGWSADDSELFAVAQPKSTGSWVLQVIPNPTVPTPVVPVKTSLSIGTATGATTSGYGKKVQVFALLGHTFADRKVTISVTPAGEPAQLLFAGNVESYGGISVVHSLTRTSTFTVGYAGDAHNLPAAAAITVSVTAHVAAALHGAYKTTTISGVKYFVFHSPATMKLAATVTPDKRGECVRPERQEFSLLRGWVSDHLGNCAALDAASQVQIPLSLKGMRGHRFRIRADYVRSGKDKANLSSDGSWLYFTVTA